MSASKFYEATRHASLYAKHRPMLPTFVVDKILKYIKDRKCSFDFLVDVGCGNGQSTFVFSSFFTNLLGVDASKSQIEMAKQVNTMNHVNFEVGSSENLPVPNESVDLVVSSMAVHWFDFSSFFRECQRVLKPNGCLLLSGYDVPSFYPKNCDKKMIAEFTEIGKKELNRFSGELTFDERIDYVKDHYKRIVELINSNDKVREDNLIDETEMTFSNFLLYLSTWSSYQRFLKEHKENSGNILETLSSNVKQGWGMLDMKNDDIIVEINRVYFMIMSERPQY